ncbi:hypothetical protein FIU87_19705 [Bacillus sp. THAF10]|uniref:hypothetical protein n=1 Tax=Bacillus sp. THAF10 TaxID=2587848 RepID=UPI0012A839BA|nr:hypothetical protein [Bacillus sp. THAF10]QFT90876.1 hypothetical protein FIU87_19705 [Bacillus sp. THAF10]
MIQKLIMTWHTIRARYHEVLIQDCLDDNIKQSLTKKLDYHKQKIEQHQELSA